jgi:hypothetical protein
VVKPTAAIKSQFESFDNSIDKALFAIIGYRTLGDLSSLLHLPEVQMAMVLRTVPLELGGLGIAKHSGIAGATAYLRSCSLLADHLLEFYPESLPTADADWGELDYMLIDLPPGTGDIHLSLVQSVPLTGAVVVSTPQQVALADAQKAVSMFKMPNINVPVLGIIENMAYFTPEELPDNKYFIFGKDGAKSLAERLQVPLLAEIPLVQGIREAGDAGRPAALQENTVLSKVFREMAQRVAQEVAIRNAEKVNQATAETT